MAGRVIAGRVSLGPKSVKPPAPLLTGGEEEGEEVLLEKTVGVGPLEGF